MSARILDLGTDGERHRRRRERQAVAEAASAIARADRSALRRFAAWLRQEPPEPAPKSDERDGAA